MDVKEIQKTVEKIAEGLKKELGGLPQTVEAINRRIEQIETSNTNLATKTDEVTKAIDDMLARINRHVKLSETGLVGVPTMGLHNNLSMRIQQAVPEDFARLMIKVGRTRGPLPEAEQRELSSGIAADGGYLIKPEVLPIFQMVLATYGAFRRNTTVIPMTSNSATFPKLASAVNVYWIAENGAATESFPQFGEVTLTIKKLVGLTHISLELLDDANPDLAQLITQLFLRAIAQEEDRQGFNSNGVGANNPFVGVLEDPAVPALVMAAGQTNFNQLDALHMLQVQDLVNSEALPNAKYYIHRSIWSRVRQAKDTTGQFIWQAPTAGAPGMIFGYPYELVETMPALSGTAAGKAFVVFGDLAQGTMLGDRRSVTIDRTDAVGFTSAQTHIRLIERITTKVVDATKLAVIETAAA